MKFVVIGSAARFAVQPAKNGMVEIAGPEREPLSDLAQRFMSITQDQRQVVSDVHARYFGVEMQTDSLVPLTEPAWQGALNFDRWFAQSESARQAPRA